MKSFAFRIFIFFLFIPSPAQSLEQAEGIPASLAADFIHAVIEAGRTTYH